MLLKWLGEQGERAVDVVERAVAVSAPVDLQIAAKQLDCGWKKRIYAAYFLRTMKPKVLAKIATHGLDLDPRAIRASSTFREIDNLYTAPVHGFRDADDYWIRSSSKPWLRHITVPTLLINARNDPFFPGDALPTREEVSASRGSRLSRVRRPCGLCVGKISRALSLAPAPNPRLFGR